MAFRVRIGEKLFKEAVGRGMTGGERLLQKVAEGSRMTDCFFPFSRPEIGDHHFEECGDERVVSLFRYAAVGPVDRMMGDPAAVTLPGVGGIFTLIDPIQDQTVGAQFFPDTGDRRHIDFADLFCGHIRLEHIDLPLRQSLCRPEPQYGMTFPIHDHFPFISLILMSSYQTLPEAQERRRKM